MPATAPSPAAFGLRPALSVYLDLLRIVAATGVLLYHAGVFVAPWLPREASAYGPECVAVFFVLSGFVIRYAAATRERAWQDYLVSRVARIYPVAILAIAATFAADAVGRHFGPGAYAGQAWFNPRTTALDVLANLTFTNELWWRHAVVGSDEPFWSLGFEIAYYAVFALVSFLPGRWKIAGAVAWAVVAGPKIAAFLPLWLLGVGLYELMRRLGPPSVASRILAALAWPASLLAMHLAHFHWRSPWMRGMQTLKTVHQLHEPAVYFTAVGLIVAVNIWAFDRLAQGWLAWPRQAEAAIRWVAGATFTLYLCHEPMLAAVAAAVPGAAARPLLGVAACAGIVILAFALAELGERPKRRYRRWVRRIGETVAAAVSAPLKPSPNRL